MDFKVTQEIRVCDELDKKRILYDILAKIMDGSKVIIFTTTKRTADELTYDLRKNKFPARAIHGDKSQNERDWALAEFKSGKSPLLVVSRVSRAIILKCIIRLSIFAHLLIVPFN